MTRSGWKVSSRNHQASLSFEPKDARVRASLIHADCTPATVPGTFGYVRGCLVRCRLRHLVRAEDDDPYGKADIRLKRKICKISHAGSCLIAPRCSSVQP
jgi:hypothetical protein